MLSQITAILAQPGNDDSRPPLPIARIHMSLAPGASRRSVIRDLYKAFGLPAARLEDLARRPVDLAADLDPIRRALAIHRVVLVFDSWDNIAGRFGALHEYLCHTHWGEFLRVLAQPHLPTLFRTRGNEFQLRYCLLVLSRHKATELSPWAQFLWEDSQQQWVADKDNTRFENAAARVTDKPVLHAQTQDSAERITDLENVVRRKGSGDRSKAWKELVSTVTFRLAAASVNGIRRGTLRRCLEDWCSLFWTDLMSEGDWPRDIVELEIAGLETKSSRLIEVDDEELESLPASLRSVELSRRPRWITDPGKVVMFPTISARSQFMAELMEDEQPSTCDSAHIHFLLAEECLRQGTAQLRHLPGDSVTGPYAVRRIVQAIWHGLSSLEVPWSLKPESRGEIHAGLLPDDPDRRYRYLYAFLYRHILEGNNWKLGRAFGRPDIRVDLLMLFVRPQLGGQMLQMRTLPDEADLPAPGELAQLDPRLREDPTLWCDLLEALGTSGYELGGDRGDHVVRWALQQLPGGADSARTNALLPPRGPGGTCYQTATIALRLRIDWLLSKGQIQEARTLCFRQLARLGIDESVFRHLETRIHAIVDLVLAGGGKTPAEKQRPEVRKAIIDAIIPLRAELEGSNNLIAQRATTSTVLFRLGDVLVSEANMWLPGTGEMPTTTAPVDPTLNEDARRIRGEAKALACSCVVYWAADKLRSEAGGARAGTDWPRVGARSMRSYIRVCLRLARVLSEAGAHTESERSREVIQQLLEHGQKLLDIHTRHHFESRKERISMLVLEVDRVRTWVLINLKRNATQLQTARSLTGVKPGAGLDAVAAQRELWQKKLTEIRTSIEDDWNMLTACWNILDEADAHLSALGWQPAHIRRPYLARIETAIALNVLVTETRHLDTAFPELNSEVKNYPADAQRYLRVPRALCDVLTGAGDTNIFWLAPIRAVAEKLGRTEMTAASGQ